MRRNFSPSPTAGLQGKLASSGAGKIGQYDAESQIATDKFGTIISHADLLQYSPDDTDPETTSRYAFKCYAIGTIRV